MICPCLLSRDSQRGTFLSRSVLAANRRNGWEEGNKEFEILLTAFGITSDGIEKKQYIS